MSIPEPTTFNGGPPDDRERAGRGLPYACVDCAWRGRGALKAWNHHQEHHHRIALPNGLQAVFSCCSRVRQRGAA